MCFSRIFFCFFNIFYISLQKKKNMSKIFGFYANDVDKVWYDSSNIKYSECIDHDNKMKTLKVVFKNGTQYKYDDVDVNHYLLFREDLSQGKALNKYIKGNGYEYEKLDDANLAKLDEELAFRRDGGLYVKYDGHKLSIKDNKDTVICEKDVLLTKDAFDTICVVLESLDKKLDIDCVDLTN